MILKNNLRVQARELLNRFESKEDIHWHLINQDNFNNYWITSILAGVYLPSLLRSKLTLLRDIIVDKKKKKKRRHSNKTKLSKWKYHITLRSQSKLIYDAMTDPELAQYLPTSEKLLVNQLKENFSLAFSVR